MAEDREDIKVFTDRLSYWRFIQDVEYDILVTSNKETKNKEIYNKNELIAVFRPHDSIDAEIRINDLNEIKNMKTLNKLRDEIHEYAINKGFWNKERETGTLLMLIVSEISETLEADRSEKYCDLMRYYEKRQDEFIFKHKQETDPMFYPRSTELILTDDEIEKQTFEHYVKDTFEDELADAVIRILDLCGAKGIDIEKHIELKMKYNATRERMHGKKY